MARPRTDNIRVNIFMEPKVLQALKTLARRRGTTYSQLIRDASRTFVITELKREQAASAASPADS